MQRFISWWGHHCIIIESKSVCSMHYISLQYFLLCTFAIPSSISLIFRKSTQFAASQLFLLNMVFDFNLWSIFQISRKFFSLTKLSTFSLISLILATSSDLGSIVEGRLMSCRAREMQIWVSSRTPQKISFNSFSRGLFGIFWQNNHRFRADWSGSIYVTAIDHNSEPFCPEPSGPVGCGEYIIGEHFRDLLNRIWSYWSIVF